MQDSDGRVVSGTMSNLFVVRGREWLTPSLERCGVQGTMRSALLSAAAAAGLHCREAEIYPAELLVADELFLTNAIVGVWPVRALDGVARGVGPMARLAQEWVRCWS